MTGRTKLGSWASVLLLAAALPGAGQQPRLANARVETRSAASGLRAAIEGVVAQQQAPAWIGYAVPPVDARRQACCSTSSDWGCCGACQLEKKSGNNSLNRGAGGAFLEGPRSLLVLARVESRRVERIRVFTEDCQLDAGGLPFFWLTEARPGESVAWLESFVRPAAEDSRAEELAGGALTAIALHAGPEADRAMERFVAPSQPERVREKAAFWLGAARGRRGYEVLKGMLEADPSRDVREKVVFALYVSKEPEAVETLIRAARSHPDTEVRSKAIFWLAQKAGKKAAATITEAIENDPETEVKTRAVFALSQLPEDEGVPLLIKVACTNRNPTVRKKAIFWLGQSGDPRALAFFEEILSH